MGKSLKAMMLFTDIGFLFYWAVTFLGWIPNLFLMIYPLFFFPTVMKKGARAA
ncbi:DUF5360 family protein [Paenibacillus dendritiformis]|uniref:DUF5360 family protein n=1 Tax=Paenibacillus dendritiformis TaxID=130049 RepID=UPI0018CEAC46|nr:DUF5360 family protein [Paenibacillus dendritiformis]